MALASPLRTGAMPRAVAGNAAVFRLAVCFIAIIITVWCHRVSLTILLDRSGADLTKAPGLADVEGLIARHRTTDTRPDILVAVCQREGVGLADLKLT